MIRSPSLGVVGNAAAIILVAVSLLTSAAIANTSPRPAGAAPTSKLVKELQKLCLEGQPANLNETSCSVSHIEHSNISHHYLEFTAMPRSRPFPGARSEEVIAGQRGGHWSVGWHLYRRNGKNLLLAGPSGLPYTGSGVECPPRRVLRAWRISSSACTAYVA